jgi:kynureninase
LTFKENNPEASPANAALKFQLGEAFADAQDAADPLALFRDRFFFPKTTGDDNRSDNNNCLYLCGHSLGLQPKSALDYIEEVLQDWEQLGVEGHFHALNPWTKYHKLLTEPSAALAGAKPSEVVVMNTLTVNLHLMMVSFYRPTGQRYKIIVERGAFPSDQYAIKSQIQFHGFDPETALIEMTPRAGEFCLRDEDVHSLIDQAGDSVALILLGAVNYATGQAFDLAEITKAGHRKGCIVGFDLAHSFGNLPLHLHDWSADFAVWCNYKYLNGGPGCIGGCFVHEHHAKVCEMPRFAGWWGVDTKTRFKMGPEFQPIPGAEGWQVSNPPVIALAPLRASLEIFAEAGFDRLRTKSIALTGYLEFLLNQQQSSNFSTITPLEPERRGAQLSIRLPRHGRAVCDKLIAAGVIGDWREPDIYRVAPVPLYNSYRDVYRFVQQFLRALG